MKTRTEKFRSAMALRSWRTRVLLLGVLTLSCARGLMADDRAASPNLTVHEWGTFTAIAGNDGYATEWTPFIAPTDLPGFVEHLSNANFKLGLRGTIRMETPVMYFYSPRDVTVSVRVAFSKGIITEWYPHASHVQPIITLQNANLSRLKTSGTIAWNGIAVSPNLSADFPREGQSNRYYAARETSSTPLRVTTASGSEQEKFLFYRGVSAATLPLAARQDANGTILVKNLSTDEIPSVILFERRGQRVGYRLSRSLAHEAALDPPVLTGNIDSLCAELEGILADQGLYPDEAHAMVETWRDTWFEEGSRLIYVVPREFVDQVLPLTITPTPGQIIRVFIGRLEIVTPATAKAVEAALAANDEAALEKYGRFLEPILRTVHSKSASESLSSR